MANAKNSLTAAREAVRDDFNRVEVKIRAIPFMTPEDWRLCGLDEFPTVGTVPKNYLAYGDPNAAGPPTYFAKKVRTTADARECATEEIISKIGAMPPLEMASSKLTRLAKTDVRFLSRNFVVHGRFELHHGIETAEKCFEAHPSDVEHAFDLRESEAEQSFHNIHGAVFILEWVFPNECADLKKGFVKMSAFDAFIGAPDRHAMNWGVLSPLAKHSKPVRFAPVLDTARGLFREISDTDLLWKEQLQERGLFLQGCANRSRPIFSAGEASRPNHFSLVW